MRKRLALFLLIATMFCLVFTGCGDIHENELQVPMSASDCSGEDYQAIISAFQDAGFSNVSTEVLDDLVTGWLTSDGEVEQVSIDGADDFSAGDWYHQEAEVVVTYHTFPDKSTEEPGSTDLSVDEPPETPSELPDSDPEESNDAVEKLPELPAVELPENSTFSVHFIDVGQADAALVECDGHYMLIDGGNKEDSNVIYTVLKNAGVSKLDIVVGSHAHEDHIGGIPGAFNYTTADLTLCPVTSYDSDAFEDFVTYANECGGGVTIPSVGDSYALGSASVVILGVNGGSETNDTSIVLKVQYGETSFLFTGDAEREAEQTILNSGCDLSATVLKVGHHGSDTSTTYPFLREIMPTYAVISVGDGNSYDHPTDDALSRLRDAGVEVYRTDLHGDIIMTSDGATVSISTDRQASVEEVMTPGESVSVVTTPDPEPAPEPVPDPEPEPEPETNPSSGLCWKSATGEKYHSINNCGRMNPAKATQMTIEQAESLGLEPCSKCW